MTKEKILILGATGMIGNVLFRVLSQDKRFDVFGTTRKVGRKDLISGINIENMDNIIRVIAEIQPTTVLNCVGLIKQMPNADDAAAAIYMNALFPHRLAHLLSISNIRMIHFSTDCVFLGDKGNYLETDMADANDTYGKTKYLGEVINYKNCLTLRTSCTGHELQEYLGLVEWFLMQRGSVWGFRKAIYSGIPTVELAEILSKIVIPNRKLNGLYQVSSNPISKYDLLNLITKEYNKKIEIKSEEKTAIDRSLNSTKFRKKTGYNPPSWPALIKKMHQDYKTNPLYRKYR